MAYRSLQNSCVVGADHSLMDEIEKYKRFCICCCKPRFKLMKTGRLTVVGEAFVAATQLSRASLENKPVSHVLPKRSESD